MDQKKKLIIIDSNSVIHRAFHALPPLTTKKGEQVNAVYGFLLVFLKIIKEFQPDFVVACFDFPGPTFRHKKFKEYKAKRKPAPEELYQQIPKIKEILKSFNVPIFEKEGFEADDVISTIASQASKFSPKDNLEIIILSGDLDIFQLINKNTKVYLLRKGVKDTVLYDESKVLARYQGLRPQQIVDFKALRGDPSDNIPGVKDVGEKTAIKLIKEFDSLENIYQSLNKIKPKLKELLIRQKEQAFFSKMLVQTKRNLPIDFNLNKCWWGKYKKEEVIKVLNNFEFQSLIDKLPEPTSVGKNLTLW